MNDSLLRSWWIPALPCVLAILLGVLALALMWMISFYACLTGVLLLTLALRLRAAAKGEFKDRRTMSDRRRPISPVPAHR